MKPSTLQDRINKEVLKQEKRIQELQQLPSLPASHEIPPIPDSIAPAAVEESQTLKGRKRQKAQDKVVKSKAPLAVEEDVPRPSKLLKTNENGATNKGKGPALVQEKSKGDDVGLDSILHELRQFEERLGMIATARVGEGTCSQAKTKAPDTQQGKETTLLGELNKLKALLTSIESPTARRM